MVLRLTAQVSRDAPEAISNPSWHGIIGTGQSLSVGAQGDLSRATDAAPNALKLIDESNDWDMGNPDARGLQVVPLTEPFRERRDGGGAWPGNISGLTPHHSMARTLAHLHALEPDSQSPYQTVHSAVGKGGALMVEIHKHGDDERTRKGANAYAASLFEARAVARLARERGAQIQYDAILLTHGESDGVMNNEQYVDDVRKMQADYAEDLQSITGQAHAPVLILSQQSTSPPVREFLPRLIDGMWRAQQPGSDAVICAGPKYQYAHAPGGLHLDAPGYARLGEKYAQAYYETVVQRRPFAPLRPRTATLRAAAHQVAVRFDVRVPPLRWDASLPRPHARTRLEAVWGTARGFELRDARGAHISIADVHIDDDKGGVTVAFAPPRPGERLATPLLLAYAMTQEGEGFGPGFCGGSSDGRMGWLCDSDEGPRLETVLPRCDVQRGSARVKRSDGWAGRAIYDLVEPGGASIVAIDSTEATLDRAWEGPSGCVELRVRHNQRNYCVSFSMEVDG